MKYAIYVAIADAINIINPVTHSAINSMILPFPISGPTQSGRNTITNIVTIVSNILSGVLFSITII